MLNKYWMDTELFWVCSTYWPFVTLLFWSSRLCHLQWRGEVFFPFLSFLYKLWKFVFVWLISVTRFQICFNLFFYSLPLSLHSAMSHLLMVRAIFLFKTNFSFFRGEHWKAQAFYLLTTHVLSLHFQQRLRSASVSTGRSTFISICWSLHSN